MVRDFDPFEEGMEVAVLMLLSVLQCAVPMKDDWSNVTADRVSPAQCKHWSGSPPNPYFCLNSHIQSAVTSCTLSM